MIHILILIPFIIVVGNIHAEVMDVVDMGVGMGVEPQPMIITTVPISSATSTYTLKYQVDIDIVPRQVTCGFLVIKNNTSQDVNIHVDIVTENLIKDMATFTITPSNVLVPCNSTKTVEYSIIPPVTSISTYRWWVYLIPEPPVDMLDEIIVEIVGHMVISSKPHVLVTVYYDNDIDRVLDPDEPRMANVVLTMGDKQATTTVHGQVMFTDILYGTYTLSLDIGNVPIEYIPAVPLEQNIVVQDSCKFVSVYFPMQRSGSIEGRLFVDENRNGKYDTGERGVYDVILRANQQLITITSYDGSYKFSSMLPGKYLICVDYNSLSEEGYIEYETTISEPVEVYLCPGDKIKDIDIGIAEKEKEIEFE